MSWFFAVLIVLAMGAVAVVASGRGAAMGQAYDDRPDVRLPADRAVTGDDLRALRFNTTVRGYRTSEVDALLELLAAQLDEQADQRDGGIDQPPGSQGEPPEDAPQ